MAVQVDSQCPLAVYLDRLQIDPIDQRAQDFGDLCAVVGMIQSFV